MRIATVKELIEELKKLPEDAEIRIETDGYEEQIFCIRKQRFTDVDEDYFVLSDDNE